MTLRTYTIAVNSFQAGALLSHIWYNMGARSRKPMESVIQQLIDITNQIKENAGVTTEKLGNGTIKMTSKDGTVIVRQPYEWET